MALELTCPFVYLSDGIPSSRIYLAAILNLSLYPSFWCEGDPYSPGTHEQDRCPLYCLTMEMTSIRYVLIVLVFTETQLDINSTRRL